ncbi:MAG TPA: hypothetical protein VIK33_02730 [Anaerolineae bacterium]
MTLQTDPTVLTDDPEVVGDPGGVDSASPPRPARRASRRGWLIPLVFLAGLALGWLVIGWWLWPVQWNNASPSQLRPDALRTYLTLVADEYDRTSGLAQAEAALAGWDRDDLTRRLTALQLEEPDFEKRAHLSALAAALQLPGSQPSLVSSLLSRQGILIGLVLAGVPLIAAIVLLTSAAMRRAGVMPDAAQDIEANAEEALEELLADVQMGDGPASPEQAQNATAPDEEEHTQKEEREPQQQQQEEEEEEKSNTDNALADLASFFGEEDTSLAALEQLVKGLPDLSAEDLHKLAGTIAERLRTGQRKMPASGE